MEQRFIRVTRTARYHVLGDAQKAKRIWIVLHGYGQLARYFLNKFEGLGTDLLIVAPEGLSRFYTDVSHQRVGATWMTREDRDHEIVDHVEYLDTLVAEIQKEALPDATWGVLGFSQGVATACRWLMRGNTKVDNVLLWGGQLPPDMDRARIMERFTGMHVQLVHGTDDKLVPATVTDLSLQTLKAAGVRATVVKYEGGHDLEQVTLARCLNP